MMYNMNSMNSPNSGSYFIGMIKLIVAIILIGIAGGIVLSNLPRQLAEADRMHAETEWEARVREQVDLQFLEAERELQYRQNEAMVDQALARQAEALRVEKLRHDQLLKLEAMLQHVGIYLLLLLGCSLVMIFTITLTRTGWELASRVKVEPTRDAATVNPWQDERYRRLRRQEAQLEECLTRQTTQTPRVKPTNGTSPTG